MGQQKSTCVDCGSSFYRLQSMQIYCKNCKKHTGNTLPKK